MNFKQIGNKRDEILMTVQGADTTVINSYIPAGAPLVLAYGGPAVDGPAVGSPGGSTGSGQAIYPQSG
jgi:hypothetical protein